MISILTDVPGYTFRKIGRKIEKSVLALKYKYITHDYLRLWTLSVPFGGHYDVTRSLVTGFRELGLNFNYNPACVQDIAPFVVVLSNKHALSLAIKLKKQGKIKKLIAGPNLVHLPDEQEGIILSKEIDRYVVPSGWVLKMFSDSAPSLKEKLRIWYAGVNILDWKPSESFARRNTCQVLLYQKTGNSDLINRIAQMLKGKGWEPLILRYGHHTPMDYKALLFSVKYAVFVCNSETQGMAQAQAWAMDVPTFVFDSHELTFKDRYYHGQYYGSPSSCPFISRFTGRKWKSIEELETIMPVIEQDNTDTFAPREWVARYLSDARSAERMIKIVNLF